MIASVIYSLVIAALLLVLYFNGVRKNSSSAHLLVLFSILILAASVIHFMIAPLMPFTYGISWLPSAFVVLLISLLVFIPSPVPASLHLNKAHPIASTIGTILWFVLVALLLAVVLGYYLNPIVV